jgi:hypothetical protein
MDSCHALLAMLERDLLRGNLHVAIRHFAMLQVLGAKVPGSIAWQCERLVERCAPARLHRTLRFVDQWAMMVLPHHAQADLQ